MCLLSCCCMPDVPELPRTWSEAAKCSSDSKDISNNIYDAWCKTGTSIADPKSRCLIRLSKDLPKGQSRRCRQQKKKIPRKPGDWRLSSKIRIKQGHCTHASFYTAGRDCLQSVPCVSGLLIFWCFVMADAIGGHTQSVAWAISVAWVTSVVGVVARLVLACEALPLLKEALLKRGVSACAARIWIASSAVGRSVGTGDMQLLMRSATACGHSAGHLPTQHSSRSALTQSAH